MQSIEIHIDEGAVHYSYAVARHELLLGAGCFAYKTVLVSIQCMLGGSGGLIDEHSKQF